MSWQTTSSGRIYDAGEGPVVYFEPRSGDTHLLSDFSAYVVELLAQGAMSESDLELAMAPEVEQSNAGELKQLISQVLQELETLDIVARS